MGVLGHLGVFGVIWGQNPKIFKPRQIIYQNESLGALITKKVVSEVTRGHPTPNWGVFVVKIKKFKPKQKKHIKMKHMLC